MSTDARSHMGTLRDLIRQSASSAALANQDVDIIAARILAEGWRPVPTRTQVTVAMISAGYLTEAIDLLVEAGYALEDGSDDDETKA